MTKGFICRGFSLLATLTAVLSLGGAAIAAPVIDNNAGTWTDTYNDNLGVRTTSGTTVVSASGVVKLIAGQTSGNYETVRIKPPSFGAWRTLKLSGTWSAPADVRVSVINALTRATVLGPVDYDGEVSLAEIDPVAHPELAVIVALNEGVVSPMVSDLAVS